MYYFLLTVEGELTRLTEAEYEALKNNPDELGDDDSVVNPVTGQWEWWIEGAWVYKDIEMQ